MSFLWLFLGLCILGLVRHWTWRAQEWPAGRWRPPHYQGHRGYWKGGQQENTLAAFSAAAQRGLQMVEMDVQLSLDQEPVVFHDLNLQRLTGSQKQVSDCSAVELKILAQVPTLEDVLRAANMPAYFNIELKTTSLFDGTLERKVVEVLEKNQATDRVLFSSFNPFSIWRLSKLLPRVPRALLASEEKEAGNRFYLRYLLFAPYIKTHALHLDHNYVDEKKLKSWVSRGIPVALWTVNDADKAQAYLQSGALSIISDTLGENVKS